MTKIVPPTKVGNALSPTYHARHLLKNFFSFFQPSSASYIRQSTRFGPTFCFAQVLLLTYLLLTYRSN